MGITMWMMIMLLANVTGFSPSKLSISGLTSSTSTSYTRPSSIFGGTSQSRSRSRGSRPLLQLQLSSSANNNEHHYSQENNDDDDDDDHVPFFKPSVTPEDLLGGYGGTGEKGKRKLLDQMAALYSDETMARLLDVHSEVVESEILIEEENVNVVDPTSPMFTSLHDLITHTIEQGELEKLETKDNIDPALLAKASQIKVIASDVDGTLISTTNQIMHPRTLAALRRAIQHPTLHFFPATGKSRRGALNSLGPELEMLMRDNHVAGVFLGGLYCVDGFGEVVFERKLTKEAIHQVEQMVADDVSGSVSVVGYDGDNLYSTKMTDIVVHLSDHYGEPMPQLLLDPTDHNNGGDVDGNSNCVARALADHEPGMHKLLLMSDDTAHLSDVVRPQLDQLALKYGGTVTQALPTMLELIPSGCSKAVGIQAVCNALGAGINDNNIDLTTQLLALGDAENDVAMLEMAAIGVAMGNASPPARAAADHVMDLQCDQGGAGCAMEFFCFSAQQQR
jgi:hydroxymethylpyrimidine pyrophosphatase-like HAD family hydrolase